MDTLQVAKIALSILLCIPVLVIMYKLLSHLVDTLIKEREKHE